MRVNVDLYDTNEALLAKVADGQRAPTTCSARRTTSIEILRDQDLLQPLDHSRLPHLRHLDPRFLNRDFDPGNRYSIPYFWGTCGHRLPEEQGGHGGLLGRALGPALQGPGAHARRPAGDPGRRPQVEGPQPQHHGRGRACARPGACSSRRGPS